MSVLSLGQVLPHTSTATVVSNPALREEKHFNQIEAGCNVNVTTDPVGSAAVFFACSSSAQLSLFFPAAVLVVGSTSVFFV